MNAFLNYVYTCASPRFNQLIIKITEAFNFHPLFSSAQSANHSLSQPPAGTPVSAEFCSAVLSSAAPSCFSTHPRRWVSLPCYPQLMDRHWCDAWTTPLHTAQKSRFTISLHLPVVTSTLTPRQQGTPWSPNASSMASRAMLSQPLQRVLGGKAHCFTAAV